MELQLEKKIILPSSFTGSPRDMIQNDQDAIAIYRWHRHPNLFITFTCNAQWLEIHATLNLIPDQKSKHRPDIVSRVSKMKLEKLMSDVTRKQYFGKIVGDKKLFFVINFPTLICEYDCNWYSGDLLILFAALYIIEF